MTHSFNTTLILLSIVIASTLCSFVHSQENVTDIETIPSVEPEKESDTEMEICRGSGAGLQKCVSKTCPKTGLFKNNECNCLCCNGVRKKAYYNNV